MAIGKWHTITLIFEFQSNFQKYKVLNLSRTQVQCHKRQSSILKIPIPFPKNETFRFWRTLIVFPKELIYYYISLSYCIGGFTCDIIHVSHVTTQKMPFWRFTWWFAVVQGYYKQAVYKCIKGKGRDKSTYINSVLSVLHNKAYKSVDLLFKRR